MALKYSFQVWRFREYSCENFILLLKIVIILVYHVFHRDLFELVEPQSLVVIAVENLFHEYQVIYY